MLPATLLQPLPLTPSPSSSSSARFARLSRFTDHKPLRIQFNCKAQNELKSLDCSPCELSSESSFQNHKFSLSCSAVAEKPEIPACISAVDCKLHSLVAEFRSLSAATDRVRRLLHYADLLPPMDESARVKSNMVSGCTAQVWVETRMDAGGSMRFRADSDSEITKGFCSCLIWLLDGALPEEVLRMKTEDLGEMNVGLPGRAHSRVNTWHIVLISMQKRTRALVAERETRPPPPSETFLFSGCCR